MTRRRMLIPEPVQPLRWWQGWAPAVFLLVLVGGLIYTAGLSRTANATVASLESQLATQTALVDHGVQERLRLQTTIDHLLQITPTERVIVEACVQPKHEGKRATPVFARESQFVGAVR